MTRAVPTAILPKVRSGTEAAAKAGTPTAYAVLSKALSTFLFVCAFLYILRNMHRLAVYSGLGGMKTRYFEISFSEFLEDEMDRNGGHTL